LLHVQDFKQVLQCLQQQVDEQHLGQLPEERQQLGSVQEQPGPSAESARAMQDRSSSSSDSEDSMNLQQQVAAAAARCSSADQQQQLLEQPRLQSTCWQAALRTG